MKKTIGSEIAKNAVGIICMMLIATGCTHQIDEITKYDSIENVTVYSTQEDIWNVTFDIDNFIKITREEFVYAYAKNQNISFEEADILIRDQTKYTLSYLPDTENGLNHEEGLIWLSHTWNMEYFPNPNFTVCMTGYFELWLSDTFAQINNATVGSSIKPGTYTNSIWHQLDSALVPEGRNWPTSRVAFSVVGYFTTEVKHASHENVNIHGFDFGGSNQELTETWFISDIMQVSSSFKVE